MLKTAFLLFYVFASAQSTVQMDDFSCQAAQSKPGKSCEFSICKSPSGYGIGRTEKMGSKKRFLMFSVNTKSSVPYLEPARFSFISGEPVMKSNPVKEILDIPPSVFPKDMKDDFLAYKYLSSKGYFLERDAHILLNCEDPDLAKLIADMDQQKKSLQESLKNRDYVKVVEVIGSMNVLSRMVPRSRVPSDYCYLGQNTYGSEEALKKLDGTEYKEPKGRVLSESEAQAVFEEVKNMQDIPWGYKEDGCYARAQTVAERLEKKGIAVGKVWYFGDDLWPSNLEKGMLDGWSFHVAPIVYVRGQDEKIRRMVLDPAIQNKPVESYSFGKSLSKDKNAQVITTRWAGGQSMTGFSSIQMVYTGVDYYSTESVLPGDSKASHENAQKTNEVFLKRLKDKK